MVNASTVIFIGIAIGFVVLGGVGITKKAVAEAKTAGQDLRTTTQKKLDKIKKDLKPDDATKKEGT